MLLDLAKWEQRPSCLTTAAYEWCSAICENYSNLVDGRDLLFLSLEIAFRYLDPQIPTNLIHTEHHQSMVGIVFGSRDDEVIADLLHAWTSQDGCHRPPPSFDMCATHLVSLSILEPRWLEGVAWSPRIMTSLEGDQRWDKLESWMGIVWMVRPPGTGSATEADVLRVTLLLFHQRSGAIQKLERWMELWCEKHGKVAPESFRQVCKQARLEAAQRIGP